MSSATMKDPARLWAEYESDEFSLERYPGPSPSSEDSLSTGDSSMTGKSPYMWDSSSMGMLSLKVSAEEKSSGVCVEEEASVMTTS